MFSFANGGSDYPRGNPGEVATSATGGYALPSGVVRAIPGTTITPASALTISAAFRATYLVANTIAMFPIDIIERGLDGKRRPVEYLVDRCLWKKPNRDQTKFDFVGVIAGHMLLNGNIFVYVQAEAEGFSLWAIDPERVEVARIKGGQKAYRIDRQRVYFDFAAGGNIIHIPGWGTNGLVGISPVKNMMTALGLARATEAYAAYYFANGTTLSGVLSTDQKLTSAEAKVMKDAWDESHQGLRNAHEVAVLSSGLKWVSAGSNPQDSQMADVRNFQVAEVARIFGVPEHLIGSHDKNSSWGQGLEINNRAFLQFTILPHLTRIEQAFDDNFLDVINDDTRAPRKLKFNTGALMRGTSSERAAFYKSMFEMGVYTVNMILAFEDLPDIGPAGDQRFVPGNNLVPLDSMMNADIAPGKASAQAIAKIREVLESLEAAA